MVPQGLQGKLAVHHQFHKNVTALPKKDQKVVKSHIQTLSQQDKVKVNQKIESRLQSAPSGLHPQQYQQTRHDVSRDVIHGRIGKNKNDIALKRASAATGSIIAVRGTNPSAFAHQARGLPTKDGRIQGKSAGDSGSIIAGLIPKDGRHSKLSQPVVGEGPQADLKRKQQAEAIAKNNQKNEEAIRSHQDIRPTFHTRTNASGKTEYAVFKDVEHQGKTVKIENWKTEGKIKKENWNKYEVMGYAKGGKVMPATADMDLAVVAPKMGKGVPAAEAPFRDQTGVWTKSTQQAGQAVNAEFNALDTSKRTSGQTVVNHGSAAHDPYENPLGENERVIVAKPGSRLEKVSGQAGLTQSVGNNENFYVNSSNPSMREMNSPPLSRRGQ